MKNEGLEPGLVRVFRFYVMMRFGVMLGVGFIYYSGLDSSLETKQAPYILLFLANVCFLMVYLSWGRFQSILGRYYLPLALVAAAIGPIIEARYITEVYNAPYGIRLWMVFPFLSVPLILTAWQYRLRDVVLYCLGTAGLEILWISASIHLSPMEMMADVTGIVGRSVFFILLGYIVNGLVAAQRRQRLELAEANLKLVRYASALEQLTISRERNRLARELHDTLAHTLSGLAVQLEAIAALWEEMPPRAGAMLERALITTRLGLDETRRALRDLRAAPLDDVGLAMAIRFMAENVAARSAIKLDMDVPDAVNGLSPEVEQAFYRVAQEALENVVQHASASQVAVILKQEDRQLVLEIADDGAGFGAGSGDADNRFGIRGMKERAELIGGALTVESSSAEGTTVRLTVEKAL